MLGSCGFLVMLMGTTTTWRNKKDWKDNDNILTTTQKPTTYPSPKMILTLAFHLGQNVGLGEG